MTAVEFMSWSSFAKDLINKEMSAVSNAVCVLLCGSDPPIALQEEAEANRAFAICDTNCDGKIDRQQFAFFLRALGAHCALACCFQP